MATLGWLLLILMGAAAMASVGYLLVLLAAAARRSPEIAADAEEGAACPRMKIIIPAHNEEPVLAATLASVSAQQYEAGKLEVVVVADNCTDRTAAIAQEFGATVLERRDLSARGKGYALAWAFHQLLAREDADAFVIIDADTQLDPGFLRTMGLQLQRRADREGCCALQGRYSVLNTGESWRTELMTAALDLYNHVRPLGADRLGCCVGLKGNGMGFTRALAQRLEWSGASITEDLEFTLRLLHDHGIRVGYAPEARVRAQMPVTAGQAASQRERWEKGRYALLRAWVGPLLRGAVARRDLRQAEAALSLLVPPLAELAVVLLGWLAVLLSGMAFGWLPAPLGWLGAWTACAAGLALYVIGGLRLAGAPAPVFRSLLWAPAYAAWKLLLYARGRLGWNLAASTEWVRTARVAVPVADARDAQPGLERNSR